MDVEDWKRYVDEAVIVVASGERINGLSLGGPVMRV
jgi:hypothetical protein